MENRASTLPHLLLLLVLLAPLSQAASLVLQGQLLSADRLTLLLDRPIKEADYRLFHLSGEDGLFRRVIDIKADYPSRLYDETGTAPVGVRIGQFDPRTARVVLYHPRAFNISVKPRGNRLIIDIDAAGHPVYNPSGATQKQAAAAPPEPQVSRPVRPRIGDYRPVVVIDAGHGGRDSGASYSGIREKDIVIKIAHLAANALKDRGFEVVMTRKRDRYIALEDRTNIANKASADVFVSIHANANPLGPRLQGLETYFLSPARSDRAKEVAALENSVVMDQMTTFSQEAFLNLLNRELVVASNKLAIDVQRGMLMGVREAFESVEDNGVREGPFWVLVGAQMPSILVETGYLTNGEDRKRLVDETYQRRIAIGIADGVETFIFNQMGGR
jgi:N-acetylmuramoyl-L-alanine amidase